MIILASQPVASSVGEDIQIGGGWRILRVTGPEGARVVLRVTYSGPAALFEAVYAGSDTLPTFGWFTTWGVALGAEAGDITYRLSGPSGSNTALNAVTPPIGGGTKDTLVFFSGAIDRVAYEPEGGVQYEVLASGPVTPVTGSDFEGGAWAEADPYLPSAHAGALRSLEFDVEHSLVGWFLQAPLLFGGYAAQVTLTSGATYDDCDSLGAAMIVVGHYVPPVNEERCVFYGKEGPRARGPGHYRLDWTGAGGSALATPLGAWADVDWPPS